MTVFRQYAEHECIFDGYPWAWGHETQSDDQSNRYAGDGPRLDPPIKDQVREWAEYRCLRCGHPYPPGIAKTHPRGEWTPCDECCTHTDPVRWRQIGTEDWFNESRLDQFGETAATARLDEGPYGLVERYEVEAHWRILTVHHLDEDKGNCRWWNLASLCQRCHLRMQRAVVMDRPWHYEHSRWFRPFAAGFYAMKYLGEDLGREEVEARMDELLALEHRFTQESLLPQPGGLE